MEFRSTSPAPRWAASIIHSKASLPLLFRPPCVVASKPLDALGLLLTSTETTMHWSPKRLAAREINSGFARPAVLIPTLSAPARNRASTSSTVRTPPPTVNGINNTSAVRFTISIVVSRFALEAVMSRKINSSAPESPYSFANSTGSPASARFSKFTPLTTRPASTSRQGMTRMATLT